MALVKIYKGILRVSHQNIAKNTDNKTKNLKAIITKYINDLKKLGNLPFKINSNLSRIYYLNEKQAILLLTYLKNSKTVKKFKTLLLKTFHKMKRELKSKDNNISKILENEIERNIKLKQEYKLARRDLVKILKKTAKKILEIA